MVCRGETSPRAGRLRAVPPLHQSVFNAVMSRLAASVGGSEHRRTKLLTARVDQVHGCCVVMTAERGLVRWLLTPTIRQACQTHAVA